MPYRDPKKKKEQSKRYYHSHKDKCREIRNRYEQTEKGKLANKRKFAKYNKTEKGKMTRRKYQQEHKTKMNEKARLYRLRNPAKVLESRKRYYAGKGKINARKNSIKQRYGISLEQYDQMFEKQNGRCAICGKPETAKFRGITKRLQVDHCHRSKKVRGLLCNVCNVRLGVLENKEFCKKAEKYLSIYITPE